MQTDKEENLCRTKVKIKLSENTNLQDLLINPLGNHQIMVEGKTAERIVEIFREK